MKTGKCKLTKVLINVILLVLLTTMVTACATKDSGQGNAPNDEPKNFKGRTLEIMLQAGGSSDYYTPIAEKMKKDFPGLTVNVVYDVGASDIMKTRTLSNNAPDIFNLNVVMYSYFGAIEEGLLRSIDDILQLKTKDGSAKLKDIIDEDMLNAGFSKGKYYLFPEIMYTSGLWYDANLLKKNNLEVPTTWPEFMNVMNSLKSKGIKGFGYCGVMASEYALDYFFWPQLISISEDDFKKVMNLEDNAWDTEGVKELVNRCLEIRDAGLYDNTTIALGNSETQMQFINHGFAFLPCGSWLEAEMADAWTDEWDVSYLPFSGRNDKDGDNYCNVIPLLSGVYSKTKNADIVGEFYRCLYSDTEIITEIVSITQNGLPIKDFAKNYGSMLDKSVTMSWQAMSDGMRSFIAPYTMWYPELSKLFADNFNAMMSGSISGDEFRSNMAGAAKAVKDNPDIVKYTYGG